MTDLSQFNPTNADELLDRIGHDFGQVATDWWKDNSELMAGYLKYLATAAIQTRAALLAGEITPEYADIVMHDQERAFKQTLQFATYMTLVLAQQLYDTLFRIIGSVIFNKTGINLWPELVKAS